MRIPCPYCGSRDISEFAYSGDATVTRPSSGDAETMHDYVYLRDNRAGLHQEYWYHAAGCRSWLTVTRNVVSHEVIDVVLAAPEAIS
jgi:sarcosine oxidase subunit delta